jgi:hypothetical protein
VTDPVMQALVDADGDYFDPAFLTALSQWNIDRAWRPRDEFDVDVHPESYRGKVLAFLDAIDDAEAKIRAALMGSLLSVLLAKRDQAGDSWRRRPDSNR